MLKAGVFGLGNMGGQTADLAVEQKGFDGVAINLSARDLSTLKTVDILVLGDEKGAGKDIELAKSIFKKTYGELFEQDVIQKIINNNEIYFVISSTAGGSGAAMAYLFAMVLKKHLQEKGLVDRPVVLVHALGMLSESYISQKNSQRYLAEVLSSKITYMSYDNNKYANLPINQALAKVNEDIVHDLCILRGDFIDKSQFNGLDERELKNLCKVPGRLMVLGVDNISSDILNKGTVDSLIKNNYLQSSVTEIGKDPLPKRMGTIVNIAPELQDETTSFNVDYPLPDIFSIQVKNNAVNFTNDPDKDSFVYLIYSGLKRITDRARKIEDRIIGIEAAEADIDTDDGFDDIFKDVSYDVSSDINDDDEISLDSLFDTKVKPKQAEPKKVSKK